MMLEAFAMPAMGYALQRVDRRFMPFVLMGFRAPPGRNPHKLHMDAQSPYRLR
jgi:hypothetical protein